MLGEMTQSLAERGPDRQQTWVGGRVGLGHALFGTTSGSDRDLQPASLDDQVWIVADARIDAQAELRRELKGADRRVLPEATDAELILHAYLAWGEDCVRHLLGDFVFAIWDARTQRIFCARDHFGVKPFFFARVGERFIFSNSLECVRLHPRVSNTLNDLSIADHLLFEFIQDPTATVFADIRRLAPAQALSWSGDDVRTHTYWTLPDPGVRYREGEDYVARFRELLSAAVSDRLRTDKVAAEMSGGLDSTSVTAIAKERMQATGRPFELTAYAMVFDSLFDDPERRFATLAAKQIGVPIEFSVADDFQLFEVEATGRPRPEPWHSPLPRMDTCTMAAVGDRSRVMLTGWDGDALLNESVKPYFRSLFRQGRWFRLSTAMWKLSRRQKRILPSSVREWFSRKPQPVYVPAYPSWLNPGFEQSLGLRERWDAFQREPGRAHPVRPAAFSALGSLSSSYFDFCDAGVSGFPLEFRHPLLDLRLVEYCLSLPPIPWCYKKEILRRAMVGALPDEVCNRPKTSLRGSPVALKMAEPDAVRIDEFVAFPALSRYVVREKIRILHRDSSPATWMDLRPLSLNFWLEGLQGAKTRFTTEGDAQ